MMPLPKHLGMLLHILAYLLTLLLNFVARWSSMSHVFGDACKYAWYPIIKVVRAPLAPAKPGPTLKGTRMVWTAVPF